MGLGFLLKWEKHAKKEEMKYWAGNGQNFLVSRLNSDFVPSSVPKSNTTRTDTNTHTNATANSCIRSEIYLDLLCFKHTKSVWHLFTEMAWCNGFASQCNCGFLWAYLPKEGCELGSDVGLSSATHPSCFMTKRTAHSLLVFWVFVGGCCGSASRSAGGCNRSPSEM